MSKVSRVVVYLVVGALIGLLIGFVITRAQAADAATVNHLSPSAFKCPGCVQDKSPKAYSLVRTPNQGVRKYRAGQLGRARASIRYPAAVKRKIINALMHEYARVNGPHGVTRMTSNDVWSNFTSHDSCVMSWQPGGGGATLPGYYTCQHSLPKAADWTEVEVRGYICSGLAGIAIMSTSGFALVGVGAGWSACMWEGALEAAARN